MRLLLFLISITVCHAKLNEAMQKTIDEIMPAIKTISGGAPEDWNERDKSSFDQFIVNIVKGKLLTISEELTKLKQRSKKAYELLRPIAIYFKNGYEKMQNKDGKQFFINELPSITHEGVGFGDMMAIAFNYWQLPDPATEEINRVFPEVFEIEI